MMFTLMQTSQFKEEKKRGGEISLYYDVKSQPPFGGLYSNPNKHCHCFGSGRKFGAGNEGQRR